MRDISRRTLNKYLGATGAMALTAPLVAACQTTASGVPTVVVVGGGFGGATAAKYLKRFNSDVNVILVNDSDTFYTCPFSNTVLGGMNKLSAIAHGYERLESTYGVKFVKARADAVDPDAKTVRLSTGDALSYDKLILSPGIDFRFDEIEGYNAEIAETIPHAWKAGAQTSLLRNRLEAMDNGDVFLIAPPANPFRCPPGPYERISLIANYMKKRGHRRSKILVIDPKEKFSKEPLFRQGWERLYKGMIEVVRGEDQKVVRVDAPSKSVVSEFGDVYSGAVVNYIPQQKAGAIAFSAGVADKSGWCPVDQATFRSTTQPDIHVIGDASIASPMPKSGFAASTQAKVCAAAIASDLAGDAHRVPTWANTCYSLLSPDYGISVAAVYALSDGKIVKVKGSGGVSPKDADSEFRYKEAEYARGWYASITEDVFA